jgi:3-methyl-2-oxobutanoate hydroxymethyltransferase
MKTKVTLNEIMRCYAEGRKIVASTAYDYTLTRILDPHVDIILVGDSLGNVIQGQETTLSVTLDDVVYHSRPVVRGAQHALVVADLPFLSYQMGPKEALASSGRVVKEAGVAAVKLEGGRDYADTVRFIVRAGIPVMGHLGLTPQFFHRMGGHRVQGRDAKSAQVIREDAEALQESGAFAIVLEGIPSSLAAEITETLVIPTIGIGAGINCSGQILVSYDLLGLTDFAGRKAPRMVKEFLDGRSIMGEAIAEYANDVRESIFPAEEHSFS